MRDPTAAERPNRIPWPPLIYGAALAAGIALDWFWPLGVSPMLAAAPARAVGALIAACGLSLDLWALLTLYRARTNVLPHRAADHLVTHGPFTFTRNPIYLGNTLLVFGLGLALANVWLILLAPLAAVLTDQLAAKREEAHLAARFGAPFEAYRARVPRWIGPARPIPPRPSGPDRN